MRIAYCTNVRLPSERAHGHQVAQVCDALVNLGHAVTIFAPFRRNPVLQDYWSYYGADRRVQLQHLGTFDPIDHPLLPKFLQLFLLNWFMRRSLKTVLRTQPFDLLYTRSPALLPILVRSRDSPSDRVIRAGGIAASVILELHRLPQRGRSKFLSLCKQCALIVCLTSPMRGTLIEWGMDPQSLIVEGDAVDLARFHALPSPEEARMTLGIKTHRTVVGYVGRLKTLGMEKGVSTILEALAELKSSQRTFGLIVGGPESDRREYEQKARSLGLRAEDVLFTGEIPASDIPRALSACDILAMPFPDFPHYRNNMSPLKMFEYMAAGKPIVASDLPTIRDVLSEETAIFCQPGDAGSFGQALEWITQHPADADTRATAAHRLVEHYTWSERMKRILAAARLGSS